MSAHRHPAASIPASWCARGLWRRFAVGCRTRLQRILIMATVHRRRPFRAVLVSASVVLASLWLVSIFWSHESSPLSLASRAEAAEPAPTTTAGAPAIKFNRDIRQLLSDNCYHCHGPDAKHREADLRLDQRDAAITAKAIVPGKISESELVRRVNSTDPDVMMPPPESNKKLSPEQKKLLTDWVAQGAEYEAHWSFTPLKRPAVPATKPPQASPIDAFIVAELEEQKLKNSPAAAKHEQLRRLSLDLIGLPPTPAEVAEFVNDDDYNAYAKQVDRLLASPHFGERWATWWFDVARFTDTVGYHGDQNARNFPYRDYVIDSFNKNKPFDLFTREQLAGDLLPNPTPEQLTATGFNRLNMVTREGGAQPKEYLAKYNADRVKTVATTWLGATLGCAECHDHKFDPFSQKDFYALAAFFGDVQQWGVYSDYGYTPNPDLKGFNNDYPFPPEIQVENAGLAAREKKLGEQLAQLAQQSPDTLLKTSHWKTWLDEVQNFLLANPTGWQVLDPLTEGEDAQSTAKTGDGYLLPNFAIKESRGQKIAANTAILTFPAPATSIAALRLELGTSADPQKDPLKRGNVKLTAAIYRGLKSRPVTIYYAAGEHQKPKYNNGQEQLGVQNGWQTTGSNDEVQKSVWLLDPPAQLDKDELLVIALAGEVSPVRLSYSPLSSPNPLLIGNLEQVKALRRPPHNVNTAFWTTAILSLPQDIQPSFKDQWAAAKKLAAEYHACRGGKTWTLVTKALDKPLPVRVFPRGNWQDETLPELQPETLHFLPGLKAAAGKRYSRLDLANWICSPENPLTARTITNRLWKEFFGHGLSRAVDDLGAQGDAPSHPELLDWLAVEFRENGWDVKQLMRLIVMSDTYRQAAATRPELRKLDPGNRLLSFQNPRRLDAEFVRDNALAIAGILNLDMGGPSVKPYQPADYYDALQFPSRKYTADIDDRQYRRGVYMHWQRTFLHPMLANFDAPSREECTALRVVSNTPQQALTLLNDPTFVEAARAFAERLLTADPAVSKSSITRIDQAFRLAVAREPTAKERASLLTYLESQRKLFQSGEADPDKLLAVGLRPANDKLDKVELAVWTSLCRVMLNLHETVTR
jgi:hypothetical protein